MPVNALLVISGITLVFILIGDMNRLATLATMPFLITYGAIEYSYFALSMQFEMNQRRLQNYRAQGSQSPTFEIQTTGGATGQLNGGGNVVNGAVEKVNKNSSFCLF